MITPEHCALILIDMQRGFIEAASSLCVAGAASTVPVCARALDYARRHNILVVHAIRSYKADGSDIETTRYDTWLTDRALSSAALDPCSHEEPAELAPVDGDITLIKPRFSAFFRTDLDALLKERGINTVLLAGTTTPNCIRTTCYDALSLDYNVVVLEDCTSSRNDEVQKANITDMAHIGASIMSCENFEQGSLASLEDTVKRVRG